MKRTAAIFSCLILAACASPPERIKPVANQGPCTDADRTRLADLYKQQSSAATGDAVGVFLVGVPVSSAVGGDKEPEIAVLKGRCGEPPKPAGAAPAKKHPAG